jgi:hypothetical protein
MLRSSVLAAAAIVFAAGCAVPAAETNESAGAAATRDAISVGRLEAADERTFSLGATPIAIEIAGTAIESLAVDRPTVVAAAVVDDVGEIVSTSTFELVPGAARAVNSFSCTTCGATESGAGRMKVVFWLPPRGAPAALTVKTEAVGTASSAIRGRGL